MASVWFRWLTSNTVTSSVSSDHWADEVRARCRDEQAAVDQSRRERDASPSGGAVLGMSIKAVLQHARRARGEGAEQAEPAQGEADLDVVSACYQVHASRLQLMAALNAQERIDQLSDLVRGRADAGMDVEQDRPLVQAMRREVHDSVFQAMADWRTAGQHLTRCAKILPSQLRQDVQWPNSLATVRWSGISRSTGNLLRDAQAHYLECRALLDIARGQYEKARRERSEMDHAFSMGGGVGARVGAALMAERAHYAALVETEAMHAIGLFRLNYLVLGSADSALA